MCIQKLEFGLRWDDTSKSASRFHDENDEILAQVARSGHGVTTHGAEHEPDLGLWGWSCLKQEVGQWRPPEVPSNPSCSVILCLLPLITTKAACHCKIKWSTCRWSWQLWREWENKFKSWCFFLQFLSCMLMLGQKAFFLEKHSLCIFSCWFVSISVASSVLEWCWRRTFTSDH